MSRYTTRKMKGGVKRRVRSPAPAAKPRKTAKNASASGSSSTSGSAAPSMEIRSDADVKKAIGLLNKHPLTVVLVYAVWCPHCHTFMEQWNKYKKLPNRNSPMISVEQTFMNKLLPHIQTKEGSQMSVEGFPTVIMNMNKVAVGATKTRGVTGQNVGEIIEDPRNEMSMSELLTNSGKNMMNVNSSAVIPTSTIGTTAVDASVFENSIQGSQPPVATINNEDTMASEETNVTVASSAAVTPPLSGVSNSRPKRMAVTPPLSGVSNSQPKRMAITKKVAAAIKNASNEAESLRSKGSAELGMSNISASNKGSFVSRPKREAMAGGSRVTSGLCQLGGGSSRANSLLAQLGAYASSN